MQGSQRDPAEAFMAPAQRSFSPSSAALAVAPLPADPGGLLGCTDRSKRASSDASPSGANAAPPKGEKKGRSFSLCKQHCSGMLVSVSVFAAITGLLMGYDMCIVAVVLDPVDETFGLCGDSLTCGSKTLFVSILAPGAIVSCCCCCCCEFHATATAAVGLRLSLCCCCRGAALQLGSVSGGFLADKLGRRPGLLLSDICLLVAALCFGIGSTFPVSSCCSSSCFYSLCFSVYCCGIAAVLTEGPCVFCAAVRGAYMPLSRSLCCCVSAAAGAVWQVLCGARGGPGVCGLRYLHV